MDIYLLEMYLFIVCSQARALAKLCKWRSNNNLLESVLLFQDYQDWHQVLLPTEPSSQPSDHFYYSFLANVTLYSGLYQVLC